MNSENQKIIEDLAFQVVRQALLDLLEGYKYLYPKYGEDVINIDRWDEPVSLYGHKRKYYIYDGVRHYNGTLAFDFADALAFIYSDHFKYFCNLEPGVIIHNVKMIYEQERNKAKIKNDYRKRKIIVYAEVKSRRCIKKRFF